MPRNQLFLAPLVVLLLALGSLSSPAYATGADFNDDGFFDSADIDALVAAIVSSSTDLLYDLTSDGLVNKNDLAEWLFLGGTENLGVAYSEADANLDGTVGALDFEAWNVNRFMAPNSWSGGDFNADGIADGYDFLIWNNSKNESAGGNISSVPEPSACLLMLTSLLLLLRRRH